MSIFYKIGLIVCFISATFLGGFFYGQNYERNAILKITAKAFQNLEVIKNEIQTVDAVDMCIVLGGLPHECTDILRGLDETTKSEQSDKNGTDGRKFKSLDY